VRRLAYFLPLAVFGLIAAYFLAGLGRDPSVLPSALIDRPVPAFDLPGLPGYPRAAPLADVDLRGDGVKLVNVFASWCIPCRIEHPLITRLARDHGIPIYGIAYKDEAADAIGWLDELGDPYRAIGYDRDGRVAIDWGVYGVPETYVIDGQGVIRYRIAAPLTPMEVEETLLPLIRSLGG